jgi:hypothetical protein
MTTYWRNPESGLIEGIDAEGRVVSLQSSFDHSIDDKAGFVEEKRPDGTIIHVQKGLDITQTRFWQYSPMLGGAIAAEVAAGSAISTLHKKFTWAPPYAVIARWLRINTEFKAMIDQAMKDRAVVHFEEAIQTADEVYEKLKDDDDHAVAAAKLKIDSRKFATEKGDKERFGTGKGVQGEVSVQIVIDTGIRRDEPKDVTPALKEIPNDSGS